MLHVQKCASNAVCAAWEDGWDGYDLEERSIFLSVVVLLSCVLPRNPKDGLFIVLPDQAGIPPAVYLINQPLSQFAVAAADWQAAVLIQVHLWGMKQHVKVVQVWLNPRFKWLGSD